MKSYSFLFWAFAVTWLGIAAYIGFLSRRLSRVTTLLERLERRADEGVSDRR